MKKPELLKQLSILRVKPDDVIILMYDGILSEQAKSLIEQMIQTIPVLSNNHVLILEDALKIGVIRKDKR